jgi:hypothetical protein
MMLGWKLTQDSPRHIKVEHPTHTDVATLVDVLQRSLNEPPSLTIEYNEPEKVPRALRTGIQSVFRRALARGVQGTTV